MKSMTLLKKFLGDMSVLNKEDQRKLIDLQGGKSPVTEKKFKEGERIETHHRERKRDGGGDEIENLMVVRKVEHFFLHFCESKNMALPKSERVAELNIVFWRWRELNSKEKDEFKELVRRKIGTKIGEVFDTWERETNKRKKKQYKIWILKTLGVRERDPKC